MFLLIIHNVLLGRNLVNKVSSIGFCFEHSTEGACLLICHSSHSTDSYKAIDSLPFIVLGIGHSQGPLPHTVYTLVRKADSEASSGMRHVELHGVI